MKFKPTCRQAGKRVGLKAEFVVFMNLSIFAAMEDSLLDNFCAMQRIRSIRGLRVETRVNLKPALQKRKKKTSALKKPVPWQYLDARNTNFT
jgi:hypothetical protein